MMNKFFLEEMTYPQIAAYGGIKGKVHVSFVVNEENKWLSHDRSKKKWPRTQDLKKYFHDSGQFYWFKTKRKQF